MSIPLEKMTLRQRRDAAEWAERIGMFCLAQAIWRSLAVRLNAGKRTGEIAPGRLVLEAARS